MQAIETCRTPLLGGSVEWCDHCQFTHIRYRSCRNRHCIVPGGGLSPDHQRWIAARRRFLLPVKVLSRLFRRLVLEALQKAHTAGTLQFFGELESLRDPSAFAQFLAPLGQKKWVVY